MKTIKISDKTDTEYNVFINQITCVFASYQGGSYVRLSCGRQIETKQEVEDILKLIDD
ncbi:MAG TPA: hypothetical protein PLL09_04755 [Flavobacterium sp.]|uniref:hypothetical protein n=1 Tax=unclassified Flavobacterium TaxID=196869 RepID=UPI0025C25887|nr:MULTISPECIES: hypothetical protein [unclassified Flavobacterium]HRE77119.1 hypothetical protein [Flavobacterium sp.]